jgi:hypothetical protein
MRPAVWDARAAIQQGYVHPLPLGAESDYAEVALAVDSGSQAALLLRARRRRSAAARSGEAPAAEAGRLYGVPLAGEQLAAAGAAPEQRALSDEAKRAWLLGLAGDKPLAELAASLPHGFRRRALFDALSAHRVPLPRAAWACRVFALNQPRAQGGAGADASTAAERTRAWTADLCECVSSLLTEALPRLADSGEDDEAESVARLHLAVRLAAWTASEGLATPPELLELLSANLRHADAFLALSPLLTAAAAGAAPAPQLIVRFVSIIRRAPPGSAELADALRSLMADALLGAPRLFSCSGFQGITELFTPAVAATDLACDPTSARALEVIQEVRRTMQRLADAVVPKPVHVSRCALYAELDGATHSGDIGAAYAALFAKTKGAALQQRVALLCSWAVSEPWGPAEEADGPYISPARRLVCMALLKRASRLMASPAVALPPLHAAVLAWTEAEVQHAGVRTRRACTLFAECAAGAVLSGAAFVARVVAEGASGYRAGIHLLVSALPLLERDTSAEAQRYTAERTGLLAVFEEQASRKRQRTGEAIAASPADAQLTNTQPLQEAVSQLLELPSAPRASQMPTVAFAVAQATALAPHARSRFAAWLDVTVRRAAQELHLTGARLSVVATLLYTVDAHARFLELIVLLLRAGAVPVNAAYAALRGAASFLAASGSLPALLDVAAECAEEAPPASADARGRSPDDAAAMLAWLLARFGHAQHTRSWRGGALKRYPGLCRHACLAAALGDTASPSAPVTGTLSIEHDVDALCTRLTDGSLTYEQAVTTLLPAPPAAFRDGCLSWAARLLGATEHHVLAAAQASADARVVLPVLEHLDVADARSVLVVVGANPVLRRALLSNAQLDGSSVRRAAILRLLCTGLWTLDSASPLADATAALLRMRSAAAVAAASHEVRLLLKDDCKASALAILAALAAQPASAAMLIDCVDALGSAVRAELLQQLRTLLAAEELVSGRVSLQAALLAAAGDGVAALTHPHADPCALDRGLAQLLQACLAHADTSADARHTFAAALAQQLKAQQPAFSRAAVDAAAAHSAVWLRLRLLLPLLPLVLAEVGQKAGRRGLRETLAAALLQLLALPPLHARAAELHGAAAAAARAAEAEAGEPLAQRMVHVIEALLAGVWPAWLPASQRPAAPLSATSADALLRLQAEAEALPLPADARHALAGVLGSAARTAVELAAVAPLSTAAAALADPWLLMEDASAGAADAAAEPPKASALLAGAVRVRRADAGLL